MDAVERLRRWIDEEVNLSPEEIERLRREVLRARFGDGPFPSLWWEAAEEGDGWVYRESGKRLAERLNVVPLRETARRMGVNAHTVWTRVRRANVPVTYINWGGRRIAYVPAREAWVFLRPTKGGVENDTGDTGLDQG